MDNVQLSYRAKKFQYFHFKSAQPKPESFPPHMHLEKEIFIFLQGNAEYVIEGKVYKLAPNDVLIINEGEQHYLRPLGDETYERIVINIKSEFFENTHYNMFARFFDIVKESGRSLIKGYAAQDAGIMEAIQRWEQYLNENQNELLHQSMLLELIYILSRAKLSNVKNKGNRTVAQAIAYINENLSEYIDLDSLAAHCYISKFYLCKIFKQYTGFTVNNYIINKRILYVQALCDEGLRINEAVSRAGFTDYSNFYRAYVAHTGRSPKEDLK